MLVRALDACGLITVAPARFANATWRVLPCAGSDHSAIVTDIPLRCDPVRKLGPGRVRWVWAKADWRKYEAAVEKSMAELELLAVVGTVGA